MAGAVVEAGLRTLTPHLQMRDVVLSELAPEDLDLIRSVRWVRYVWTPPQEGIFEQVSLLEDLLGSSGNVAQSENAPVLNRFAFVFEPFDS